MHVIGFGVLGEEIALGVSIDVKAKIARTLPPPARPPGKIICGEEPAEKAKELARLLREEAKVI